LNKTFLLLLEKRNIWSSARGKQTLLTKLLFCLQNIFFCCCWCNILFIKLGNWPTNGWTQLISDGTKWIRAKNISVREFNLRIRKLGIVHLGRGVCHKSCLFSLSTKGKKQQKFRGRGEGKSQHFWGLFFASAELCLLLLRPTGCGLWIYCGFRSWEKLLRKKEQKLFSPPVTCTVWAKKPLLVSFLSKENWIRVK